MLDVGVLFVFFVRKSHARYAVHLADAPLQVFCFVKSDIGHHDFCGTERRELLIHEFNALLGFRRFAQIKGQVVFDVDPFARKNRENQRYYVYQKEKHPFINDKRRNTDNRRRFVPAKSRFCRRRFFYVCLIHCLFHFLHD